MLSDADALVAGNGTALMARVQANLPIATTAGMWADMNKVGGVLKAMD